MNSRDNPTSPQTERTASTSRYAIPQLALSDDEKESIADDPYVFVVGMKDQGARDAEITSKLRLANVPQSEIAELMVRANQFLKENRFDLGKGRVKSGLVLLALGVVAVVVGLVIGYLLVLWGGVGLMFVGAGQTVRGIFQMLTSKKEATTESETQ